MEQFKKYLKAPRIKALSKIGLKAVKFKIYLPITLVLVVVFFLLGRFSVVADLNKVDKDLLNYNQQVGDSTISISEAHLAGNISIGNHSAPAPADKKYLVLFTDVGNASTSAKQLDYGDWFRLQEDNKSLPPLPVNTTFVIPPKSTLEKQLIFIVDKTKKSFNLLVGPIDQTQQPVKVSF